MTKIPLILPKIGESTTEAEIGKWLIAEGDTFQKDDFIVEIITDKVNSDLPVEYDGKLIEIKTKAGFTAKVGEIIAYIEVSDEVAASIQTDNTTSNEEEKNTTQDIPSTSKLVLEKNFQDSFLSPVVRKMMVEHDIEIEDLQHISPSGAHNRITKKDVEHYLQQKNTSIPSLIKPLSLDIKPEDTVHTLSGMRKIIAENLSLSYQTIPHVTSVIEVDVSQLVAYRNQHKFDFEEKLTYTHILMYWILQALHKYPQFNAWNNGEEWVWKKDINLGFATALKDGNLIVPNIKKCNTITLEDLCVQITQKGNQAKSGKLKPDDIKDTTFTVSNTGIFGSIIGTPIIVRPQVAVLALGKITDGVAWDKNDTPIKVQKMFLSLSYDHKVIDGALASRFLTEIKNLIEGINT